MVHIDWGYARIWILASFEAYTQDFGCLSPLCATVGSRHTGPAVASVRLIAVSVLNMWCPVPPPDAKRSLVRAAYSASTLSGKEMLSNTADVSECVKPNTKKGCTAVETVGTQLTDTKQLQAPSLALRSRLKCRVSPQPICSTSHLSHSPHLRRSAFQRTRRKKTTPPLVTLGAILLHRNVLHLMTGVEGQILAL